jgi:hypothetical protein
MAPKMTSSFSKRQSLSFSQSIYNTQNNKVILLFPSPQSSNATVHTKLPASWVLEPSPPIPLRGLWGMIWVGRFRSFDQRSYFFAGRDYGVIDCAKRQFWVAFWREGGSCSSAWGCLLRNIKKSLVRNINTCITVYEPFKKGKLLVKFPQTRVSDNFPLMPQKRIVHIRNPFKKGAKENTKVRWLGCRDQIELSTK